MANLFGTGINQIPTNGMLGNLAFQDKAYVGVDAIGIGTTFVDSGTVGQVLQVTGGAYVSGSVGIGTTNPTSKLHVVGDVRVTGVVTATTFVGALTGTATSTTNIPNLTGAITSNNTTTSLGSFSSANLSAALTDETGSGAAVFATSPVLVTPSLGAATATSINASGIITATQLSTGASGTGVNITTDTISGPATLTIDPAAVGDNTGAVRIKGDLYVDGTQFIVNSTTIELADFNVGIATTVGTNALLDGAGIGIGSIGIRKTLTWNNSSTALKSSEDFDISSGKVYRVNGTSVLSNNTLGSGVVNSSLTSVGTLGQLQVTGVSTFSNGPVLIGSATSTGTASQPLQVTGGAYVSGSVGIGTTNPSAVLDVRGNPWFSPNTTGVKATALRLGRFIDGANAAFDIITDDNTGDAIEIQSNRWAGTLNFSRASPSGVQGTFTLTSNYLTGTSISIADTTGTTTKIKLDEAGNTYFNNTGAVLVGTATSTGTASQPLQVTGGAYVSGNLGIGTTNPTKTLDVNGDVRVSGVVTATSFSGSGTNLTGIVTSIVAGTNITVSGSTGQVTVNSTASGGAALDILEVMLFA